MHTGFYVKPSHNFLKYVSSTSIKELTEHTRVKSLPPKWLFVTVNYDISTTTQHYIPLFEHKQFWFPKRGKNYISCPMYLFTRTMHPSWCFQGKLHKKKIKTSPLLFQVISLDLQNQSSMEMQRKVIMN